MKKIITTTLPYWVLISFLLTGCTKYSLSGLSTNIQPIRKTPIIQHPQIVSLKIDSIKTSISNTVQVSIPPTEKEIENAKQLTLNQLIKNSKADVVVEPVYEINQIKNQLTVNISGFMGVYKSFRPVENKDLEMIETINKAENIGKAKIETSKTITTDIPKKKFSLGAAVLSVLILAGIIGLISLSVNR